MRVIDLYHITSSPRYYDIDNGTMVEGAEAMNIRKNFSKLNKVGFMMYDKAPLIKLGEHTVRAYGEIFEV